MSSKSNRRTRRVKMDIENKYNDGYEKREKEFNPNNGSHDKRLLVMRNEKQKQYLQLLRTKDIVLAMGFPGTAKSLIALYAAFELLDARKIEKIYIVRPHVRIAGELEIGSLKGTLAEKLEPSMIPIINVLKTFMSQERISYLMKAAFKPDAQLEVLPLEYARGMSISNAVIIIDEAQNITANSMYTVLSRLGENSKCFITGDTVQKDLNNKFGTDGLSDAVRRLQHLPEVGSIFFEASDIERSALCKNIIIAYIDLYK